MSLTPCSSINYLPPNHRSLSVSSDFKGKGNAPVSRHVCVCVYCFCRAQSMRWTSTTMALMFIHFEWALSPIFHEIKSLIWLNGHFYGWSEIAIFASCTHLVGETRKNRRHHLKTICVSLRLFLLLSHCHYHCHILGLSIIAIISSKHALSCSHSMLFS